MRAVTHRLHLKGGGRGGGGEGGGGGGRGGGGGGGGDGGGGRAPNKFHCKPTTILICPVLV